MDKHTVIVIIASVVIIIPFAYSGWNIYALDKIEFRGKPSSDFSFFDMINGESLEACNSMPFFVNFDQMRIKMFFDGNEKGTFTSQSVLLYPLSSTIINGTFHSETFSEAQYLALHFDGMFSGSTPERIDQRKLIIVTQIDSPIIGIIPYTVTNQYPALVFWDSLNEKRDELNCNMEA